MLTSFIDAPFYFNLVVWKLNSREWLTFGEVKFPELFFPPPKFMSGNLNTFDSYLFDNFNSTNRGVRRLKWTYSLKLYKA